MVFRRERTAEERFWDKVDKSGEHWIWTANVAGGYGQFWLEGRLRPAHVVSWEWANGRPVPIGIIIRHRCDIKLCVCPDCLLEGTNKDNTRDMLDRKRCGTIRYSEDVVALIRKSRAEGATLKEISRETGVSDSQISRICLKQGRLVY